MVTTRQEAIDILSHLITVVLGVGDNMTHPIRICFIDNEVESIDDFDSLEIDIIDALSYTKTFDDNTTKALALPLGHRGNLKHLLIVSPLFRRTVREI